MQIQISKFQILNKSKIQKFKIFNHWKIGICLEACLPVGKVGAWKLGFPMKGGFYD